MNKQQEDLPRIRILAERLERISADSIWAHRASGMRGSIIRLMEQLETGQIVNSRVLVNLYEAGFYILHQAAKAKR